MQQLPLEVRLADHAVFASYHAGPNEEAVHALMQVQDDPQWRLIWLWGAPQTGKSHLLQACVEAADRASRRTAFLPLGAGGELPPGILEGLDLLDLVCIDDVQLAAGEAAWERGLFRLYEGLMAGAGRLVVAADCVPAQAGFGLADLASRLSSGATYRLLSLGDGERLQALRQRARWRGLELPEETGRYLLTRFDRSPGRLFRLLDELDAAALVARKRLTLPFVKSVLGSDRSTD